MYLTGENKGFNRTVFLPVSEKNLFSCPLQLVEAASTPWLWPVAQHGSAHTHTNSALSSHLLSDSDPLASLS